MTVLSVPRKEQQSVRLLLLIAPPTFPLPFVHSTILSLSVSSRRSVDMSRYIYEFNISSNISQVRSLVVPSCSFVFLRGVE